MDSEKRVPMTMRDFFFDDPFFKNSWDDFDQVRDMMFNESRDMWKRFDEDFRQMACMTNNIMMDSSNMLENQAKRGESSSVQESRKTSSSQQIERKSSTSERKSSSSERNNSRALDRQDSLARWEQGWMFPRRWMLPSLTQRFDDLQLFKDKDNEVIRVKDDDKKFEISLDTSQYRPDELKVSVNNGSILVEGKHEENSQAGQRMVLRQFARKYSLPQNTRPEDVSSNLSSDGVLVVTANKSKPAIDVKISQS